MPIRAFDGNGRFLRSWGEGMFTVPHFLRTDPHDNIWATDRGAHQIFKFSAEGKLLMTLGQKGINWRQRIQGRIEQSGRRRHCARRQHLHRGRGKHQHPRREVFPGGQIRQVLGR